MKKDVKSITIQEARTKLGMRASAMTDQQIADLLTTLRVLCNKAIDTTVEQNYGN